MRLHHHGLPLPRLKIIVLIIVVVVGLIYLKGRGSDALILAGFRCAFGVASMRHPWITLGILITANLTESNLYGSCNPNSLPATGCTVGWLMGGPTGWISRYFKQAPSLKDQSDLSKRDVIETFEL